MTAEKVHHNEISVPEESTPITRSDEEEQCSADPTTIVPPDSSKPPSPFDKLKISSTKPLEAISGRQTCPICKKSVKFYCYRCFVPVGCDKSEIPRAKLPIKVDVIKHNKENDGKSTVAHAKIIAPDDVEIYPYFQMPKFENPDRILLLYPGPDSKTLQEIPQSSFDKLLIVDGTWRQASSMAKYNPELKNIQKVTIKPQKTLFWRYQREDDTHLATIEALYYFLKEYYETYEIPKEITSNEGTLSNGYDGRYDNILWYFKYFYEFIQDTYRKRKGKKPLTSKQQDKFGVT